VVVNALHCANFDNFLYRLWELTCRVAQRAQWFKVKYVRQWIRGLCFNLDMALVSAMSLGRTQL